ncbi:unnamed protein product [Hymenolepis diminuta]|uniref:BHLH domain-containing protein n=1 Tax=Hymenolepis diminuta TaxID=6216 RepID=A0A0R3SX86_HYMDI|nr:unnamed protein product [Hymenolepis diminuta]VUZ39595.1 unnamed protein product [Hymenolepis diminuta]
MSHKVELIDRRRNFVDFSEESNMKHRRTNISELSKSGQVENEKRVRREIANHNERRRMQSINAGFEHLRGLLPPTQDGEKLSKASILQQTAKLITSLHAKISALEQELEIYRRSGLPPSSVLADITEEVATGFPRKRRADDQSKSPDSLRLGKSDVETSILDLDDGNVSGRSSDCYDGNFGCSPSSITRLSQFPPVSNPESSVNANPRLEHLVMAIEQIEGPPGNASSQLIEKPISRIDPYVYAPQAQTVYYKFSDPVIETRPSFTYSLNSSDFVHSKQSINSFAEEFVLTSPQSNLTPTIVSACEDKSVKDVSTDVYHPVAKMLHRPIPHKYLHRPQVVVNNSH